MSADALVPAEATLEDVARAAGVSPSTASRVLNAFVRLIRRREVPA
ncbi:LacI family DNA-binding transcriptional regulator [Microbacterium sp. ZW CA_36]